LSLPKEKKKRGKKRGREKRYMRGVPSAREMTIEIALFYSP